MVIKYAAFSRALGIARASVTMAIKNGQIITNDIDKLIDIELPENKSWIDKQIAKGKTWDLNRISVQAQNVVRAVDTEPQSKNIQQIEKRKPAVVDEYHEKLRDLEYRRKLADLEKTNNANKKEEIQIKKLQGELIPYDAVKSVFIYSVETARTTLIQGIDALANIFVERLGADNEHFKELQKEIMQQVNEIIVEYKNNLIEGVDDIVVEYKEVRGRGERR